MLMLVLGTCCLYVLSCFREGMSGSLRCSSLLRYKLSCLTSVNYLVQPCSINYADYPGEVSAITTHKQWDGVAFHDCIFYSKYS